MAGGRKPPGAGAPSGSGRGKTRLRTARGRTTASQRWLQRQLNDPYVAQAKAAGYRSRAAFKLMELDDRFRLLRGARRIADLGAAPGGWLQVVRERAPKAALAGIDILPIDPLDGAALHLGDIRDADAVQRLLDDLGGQADLVLSDMAANTTGHKQTDHLRTMGLVETALDAAEELLAPGGAFVAKVLAGGADQALLARMKQRFASVRHAKPPASRKESSEWYVVAQGYRPPAAADGAS